MPISRRSNRDEYLAYGFTTIVDKGKVMPQCVLCGRVFSAFSLKPSKMIRHMECRHQDVKDKPMSFFAEMRDKVLASGPTEMYTPRSSYNTQNTTSIPTITSSMAPSTPQTGTISKNHALASYKISFKLAQSKCRHILGEDLILPSIIDACSAIYGIDSSRKVQKLDISENTVDRQIVEMSCDVKEQMVDAINKSVLYALQVDDTTDVTKGEHLMVYVRYLCEQAIEEDFLFCDPLSFEVSSEDIFEKLDNFITKENLNWSNCVAINTSGSPAMRDLKAMVRAKNPNILVIHSFLNKQIFTSYALGVDFGALLEDLVDMISFIKNQGFENSLYEQLREALEEDSRHLFVCSNTRWLSVQILDKMYEIREDILDYFEDNKNQLGERLRDCHWLSRFCFIRDVMGHAEDMLRSLGECTSNIIEIAEIIGKFKLEINEWFENFNLDNDISWTNNFPKLAECIRDMSRDPCRLSLFRKKSLLLTCKEHLEKLQLELNDYMIDPRRHTWIKMPLTANILDVSEQSIGMKLDLLDMRSNQNTEIEQELKDPDTSLLQFWIRRLNSYPTASLEALRVLLAFPSQELSEVGFQALTDLAPSERLRPNIEHDLRLALSSRMPRFGRLVGCETDSKFFDNFCSTPIAGMKRENESANSNNNNNMNGLIVKTNSVNGDFKSVYLTTCMTGSTVSSTDIKPMGHALPIKLPKLKVENQPPTATNGNPHLTSSPSMNMPVFQ